MDILNFVKQAHKGQKYKNGTLYWLHLNRVALFLKYALEKSKEGSAEENNVIIKSAFLHDVLEDTDLTKKEISSQFGDAVANIVDELTDEKCNDAVSNEYVDKMKNASEQARLIKLADLFDNISTATRTISDNGLEWTKGFFFSRVDKMTEEILKTSFLRYPKTATFLKENLKLAKYLFDEELNAWENKNSQ